MSEETHDAAKRGPLAIWVAVVVSGLVGWMLTVTFCFCMKDFDGIVASPTGLPAAQIFLNAGGRRGANVMWFWVILVQFFTGCSAMLADTRMAYAFSRDDALPLSRYKDEFFHRRQCIFAENSKDLEHSKSLHTNTRQFRLASCFTQLYSGLHWYRLEPNRRFDFQHHRSRLGLILHCRHICFYHIPQPSPVY